MRKTYDTMLQTIGDTPLLKASAYAEKRGLKADLLVKLECFNPAGSIKDRAALYMIEDAERSGRLKKGGTIIEPTSGNTGIGLAAVAARKGYSVMLVMPDSMSSERIALMGAYGAEVVLTRGADGMRGAIAKAEDLRNEIADSVIMGQFDNRANAEAHYRTTGPEIWRDTGGDFDVFVSAVGTGGTISGAGEYIKSQNPSIKVIAVEPERSPVLSGGKAGAHKIQGIGAGFVPKVLNVGVIDEVVSVGDDDAFAAARDFAKTEGILVGISSGAALVAVEKLSAKPEYQNKTFVVILPDSGERYLSTNLYDLK